MNTSKEYLLFSALPGNAAVVGPNTKIHVDGQWWYEPLNVGSIILGTAGSGKSPANELGVGRVIV